MEAARKGLDDVRGREKEARARLDELRTAVREAEAAVTTADDAVSHQRRILAAVERLSRIRELEGRHKKAAAAEERQRKARQEAAAILVTDEALTEIRDAAKTLETIESRLSAAATRITFDMTADALSGIEVDGRKVAVDDPPVQAIGPTTIAIPGRGRITVEPAMEASCGI